MRIAKLLFALIVIHSFARQADSQPLFDTAESIEAMVINADHVFIGRLAKFRAFNDKTKTVNSLMKIESELKIDDPNLDTMNRLHAYLPFEEPQLQEWVDTKCMLLVAIDSDAPRETKVVSLAPKKLEVLTADFKLLKEPDEAIRVAKEAVGSVSPTVRRLQTFRLTVPREKVEGTRWEPLYDTGGHLRLTVPADERLEARAKRYIQSSNPLERIQGAEALRFYKSEKHIAMLRKMLADPYSTLTHHDWPGLHYPVRESAYKTLLSWGVEVERPEILHQAY